MASRRNPAVAVALLAAMAVGVVALYFLSRDAASAGSRELALTRPPVSADGGCQQFAEYWQSSSTLEAPSDLLESLSNCRQTTDGSWFVPRTADDPRLPPQAAESAVEVSERSALQATLNRQIGDLANALPEELRTLLIRIYSSEPSPVIGNIQEGIGIGPVRGRYADVVDAFLLDPNYAELAAYVAWQQERREDAYQKFLTLCMSRDDLQYLRQGCLGLEDSLSVGYPPFIWDLTNPVWQAEYLGSDPPQNRS